MSLHKDKEIEKLKQDLKQYKDAYHKLERNKERESKNLKDKISKLRNMHRECMKVSYTVLILCRCICRVLKELDLKLLLSKVSRNSPRRFSLIINFFRYFIQIHTYFV